MARRGASPFANFLSRSVVPKAGLGNLLLNQGAPKGPGPKVATMNVSWNSPGQPQILDQDAQFFGEDAYLNQVYVMRCVQTIANTISGLEFRAGLDPSDPANYDPTAPLAQMLGPATPQAPGGPNPETASRAFWAWTICQYIVYGRFAWEAQLSGKEVIALWPLVSACISAVPSQGGARFFDSYVYQTPQAGVITLKKEQVIYGWRPSLTDWRVPETVLSAAKLPIYIAKGLDRYMVKLLENDMVASTLVVTPPFEEPSARRAWQEQFLTSFSGIDNRGKTIFAEAEYDEEDTSGKPLVQVEKIAQTAIDADLTALSKTAKDEICVALGVPLSLIGNAQERIYANAQSEYKNFWVLTIINLIEELQEKINNVLAPRLGAETGWFDLSRVAALQPPPIFAPPMIGDAIQSGVATAAQIANLLGVPAADSTKDADTGTVEIGEESASTGAGNGAAQSRSWKGTRVTRDQLVNARLRYETRAINSHNWDEPFNASQWLVREHIDIRTPPPAPARLQPPVTVRNAQALALVEHTSNAKARAELHRLAIRKAKTAELVEHTTQFVQDVRAVALADRIGNKVHDELAKHYPEHVLGWVDDATWAPPTTVSLSDINMARRPGGRDMDKVKGIADGMIQDPDGPTSAPIVLVKTPGSGQLEVADGYHRLMATMRLERLVIPAYVGKVDTTEGDWQKAMHEAKLNRMAELELRAPPIWHNHLGTSPEATRAQLVQHMLTKHRVEHISKTAGRAFLDNWHANHHSQHGEAAHLKRAATRSAEHQGEAFDLGKKHRTIGKIVQTERQYLSEHPDHDVDDYTFYQAGFTGKMDRNAWLPEFPVTTMPCAYCGDTTQIIHASTTGEAIPTCAKHASKGHADANPNVRVVGIPAAIRPMLAGQSFEEWYEDNEAALVHSVAGEGGP